ncbi:hypothetical protein SAMN04489841_2038 [Natrinema salaciae]|uniref:Uncharacterized protein n=1 Tax=Natrinema salaciae TaxID=1186196 RepID=A0A1H9GYW9_9EURY|nr:hypothetical protein SAMN04489841_2038 [Natrinema salaciae]
MGVTPPCSATPLLERRDGESDVHIRGGVLSHEGTLTLQGGEDSNDRIRHSLLRLGCPKQPGDLSREACFNDDRDENGEKDGAE